MTHEQLRPFIDRAVAVHIAGSDVLTGILQRPDTAQPDRYAVISADGESGPVLVDAAAIERVVG